MAPPARYRTPNRGPGAQPPAMLGPAGEAAFRPPGSLGEGAEGTAVCPSYALKLRERARTESCHHALTPCCSSSMAGRECDIAEFVTDAQLLGQSVCPAQEMLRSGPRPRSPVLLDSRQVGRRLRIDPSPRPHVPHSLAPGSQTVRYLSWLKVSVALRYVRPFLGTRSMARGPATHTVAAG